MRRRAIRKRSEPAQEVELPRPEAGDFHKAFRSRQNRQQTQQQHLIKRVDHLATLPRVRQRPEMIQKNNRFAQSTRRVHHATSLPNRWRSMDSEPYPVVTHSFTRLPWAIRRDLFGRAGDPVYDPPVLYDSPVSGHHHRVAEQGRTPGKTAPGGRVDFTRSKGMASPG